MNGRASPRRRLELDHQALGRAEHLECMACGTAPRGLDQAVDAGIVAHRIVVIERKPPHVAANRRIDRELDRAVSPAEVLPVLAERELRVVDQQVGAGDEVGMAAFVGALRRALAGRQLGRVRLVVGGVDEARAVGLDAIAERQRRMVHVVRPDAHVVDLDLAFDQVVVAHPGRELLDRHREVGVLHLARERLADRRPEAARTVDVPLEIGVEQRRQKRQALDVVPVRVADEDVAAPRAVRLGPQRLPEAMRAGTAIEQQQHAAACAHLDARGVAAIADRARPRLGDRAARAPEAYAHVSLSAWRPRMPGGGRRDEPPAATNVSPFGYAGNGPRFFSALRPAWQPR